MSQFKDDSYEQMRLACGKYAEDIMKYLPSPAALDHPDLLKAGSETQKIFQELVAASASSVALKESTELSNNIQYIESQCCVKLPMWAERRQMNVARRHLKSCIGTDYVPKEINSYLLSEKPTSELPEFAAAITHKLGLKGIGENKPVPLPHRISMVLQETKKVPAPSASSASTTSGAGG